jgi:rare lipoprotein A
MSIALIARAALIGLALTALATPAVADQDHSWMSKAFGGNDAGSGKSGRRGAKADSGAGLTGSYGASSGIASYYWQPQAVASGGRFNPNALTAAHKTLPFGTRVRVTNLNNGRSVDVVINDRGPYVAGRVIDLSRRAAEVVGMTGSGVARVNVQTL